MTHKSIMITICLVIVFIHIPTFGIGDVKTETKSIPNKLPYEFKLVVTGYYKFFKSSNGKLNGKYIKTDKEYLVVSFSKRNIQFFKVDYISNDKEEYSFPKLDRDGNTIPIDASDDYITNARNIFDSTLELKIIGNMPEAVFFGFTKREKGFTGFGRIFDKRNEKIIQLIPILQESIEKVDNIDSSLSFIYADEDLNYQIRKINPNGSFSISFQKTINPDIDDINKYLHIKDMIDESYFDNEETGYGFLSVKPYNPEFISNGKVSTNNYKPTIIDNKLFVHTQWFVRQMSGYMDYDESSKKHTINILKQDIAKKVHLVVIELYDNDDVITYNGIKYKLSGKPIFNYYYTMMPLRDLCELLKVRLIYQPISNTYLIQRFNSNYETPFNLKKVE